MKWNQRHYLTVLFLFLCLFFPKTHAQVSDSSCHLDEGLVFKQAIQHDLALEIEKTQVKELENDIHDYDQLYDRNIQTVISQQLDRSAQSIPIFGSKNDTTEFESKYVQTFENGLSLEAGYRHSRQKNNSTFATINPAHNAVWFGTLRAPLIYTPIQINDRLRNSFQGGIDSAKASLEFSKSRIGYQALQVYVQWIQAQEEIELAKETLKRSEQYLGTTRKLYRSGLVEKSSLYAAQSNVSMRKQDVLSTEAQLDGLNIELQQMISVEQSHCTFDMPSEIPLNSLKHYYEKTPSRSDIVALDKRIDSIKASIGDYDKELLPTLEVFASLENNDVEGNLPKSFVGSFSSFNPNLTVGAFLNISLDSTEITTKYKRGKINIEKFEARKRKTLHDAKKEIEKTWRGQSHLKKQIDQLQETQTLERKKISATNSEYRVGRESLLTLLLYEQEFVQLKRRLLTLETQYMIQDYALELLSGQSRFSKREDA